MSRVRRTDAEVQASRESARIGAFAICWLLVDTAANRRLVARYPQILETRFPGSSLGWVRCLAEGLPPPTKPGLAWIDPRSARIVPLRRRGNPGWRGLYAFSRV